MRTDGTPADLGGPQGKGEPHAHHPRLRCLDCVLWGQAEDGKLRRACLLDGDVTDRDWSCAYLVSRNGVA